MSVAPSHDAIFFAGGIAIPGSRARRSRRLRDRAFVVVCLIACALAVAILSILLIAIGMQGWKHLDFKFLTSFPSRKPAEAGLKAALWGSIWLLVVCAAVALPLGVGTAIFLEEFKPRRRWLARLHGFVQLNIANLAGVPSIVYGILGLTVFVRMFGLFGSPNLAIYDDNLRIRTNSGETVQGDLIDQTEASISINTVLRGPVTIPLADVSSRKTIYVREHILTLADGRAIRGTLLDNSGATLKISTTERSRRLTLPASELRDPIPPGAAPGTPIEIYLRDGRHVRATLGAPPAPDADVMLTSATVWQDLEIARAEIASHRTLSTRQIGSEGSFLYFRLPFGGSVLAGGLTLMLVILPIVIIASREAIRAVPDSLREAAFAIGCTRWQMIRRIALPSAVPGIMTGAILAMSRAIGEAAPLLVVGGFLFIMFTPRNLMDDFAAMPLQIFNWAGRPQEEFHLVAATGIVVLLAVLLTFNAAAIFIRQRFSRPLQ